LAAFGVAGVLALAAVVVPAVPAVAHSGLLSSSPAAGERLDAAPDSVSLSFSSAVLGDGADIVVTDVRAHDWVARHPTVVDGRTVVASLAAGMPAGEYRVAWRVVSIDGAPASGTIRFTVAGAAPTASSPASPSAEAAPADAAPPRAAGRAGPGATELVVVAVSGGGIALAGYFLILHLLRRRAASARAGGDGAGPFDT
jgi:methionine-rich copper-binding protein CopC